MSRRQLGSHTASGVLDVGLMARIRLSPMLRSVDTSTKYFLGDISIDSLDAKGRPRRRGRSIHPSPLPLTYKELEIPSNDILVWIMFSTSAIAPQQSTDGSMTALTRRSVYIPDHKTIVQRPYSNLLSSFILEMCQYLP